MSSVVISGNTSGTVTLFAPDVSGNTTLTLPTTTGTVMVNGPVFSAYQSVAQTISGSTYTKVQLQTEEFDTASCFDSTTNYRFTPNVSGYYQVCGSIGFASVSATTQLAIYKNGTNFKFLSVNAANGTVGPSGSAIVYLNGSTDYIELYCYLSAGQALAANASQTYFQASLVRSA